MTEEINKERKTGSGRLNGSNGKKDKYVLEFNDKKYICKTVSEMAKICNRSRMCMTRILLGQTTCKKITSAELKNIKIVKLKDFVLSFS
jgi:hypothetical protein